MVELKCPNCKKGYKLNARKDKTTRCGYCGYEGKNKEFIIKEE